MFFKKIVRDLQRFNSNLSQFLKFKNEGDEIFVEFKNKTTEIIEDFKFFYLGGNRPINISKDSKLSILDYFSLKDYMNIRFIPFEFDISQRILHSFLFFICDKSNCNNVVTYCSRRKSQNLCLIHCGLEKPCPPLPKNCLHESIYIEFNHLLDNYMKLVIDKITGSPDALESFPTLQDMFNINSALKEFYSTFKRNKKDIIYQKIRVSSTLGTFKIKYDDDKYFFLSYDNHPLRNCRTKKGANASFLQIINPLFDASKNSHLNLIHQNNINRLYYAQMFFPQKFLKERDHESFFDRINYSEDLCKKDPDTLHQPIARNLYKELQNCGLLEENRKEISILDLGCGSGNLINNVISIINEKTPNLKINLMLVDIDDRKLRDAKNRLEDTFKSCFENPITTSCCSVFELSEIHYSDFALISQVFDLYIDFIPIINDLNKYDILNKNIYSLFHNIAFFQENLEKENGVFYNDYEREFIGNYAGIIRNTLNRVIAFSDHIFIFDHFFNKGSLNKVLKDKTIHVSNLKVDRLLGNAGIKFTHLVSNNL